MPFHLKTCSAFRPLAGREKLPNSKQSSEQGHVCPWAGTLVLREKEAKKVPCMKIGPWHEEQKGNDSPALTKEREQNVNATRTSVLDLLVHMHCGGMFSGFGITYVAAHGRMVLY